MVNCDAVCCSISVAKIFRTVASFMSWCIFMTSYILIVLTFCPVMSDLSTKGTSWSQLSSMVMKKWRGVFEAFRWQMSWGVAMTEFALVTIKMHFIMSSSVTDSTVVGFRSLSGFSGYERFIGYVFNGFVGVIGEVDDGSSVHRWFLWKNLFDRRGLGRGVGVPSFRLSGSFKNDGRG